MSDAERLLWYHLRNRNLGGCKFRRQHPVGPFFADFLCAERKLIIEVDGGQHALNIELDNRRSRYLQDQGYQILRFWNNEVLQETEAVLTRILEVLSE
jgi:very-short-patch-repair endonuclease